MDKDYAERIKLFLEGSISQDHLQVDFQSINLEENTFISHGPSRILDWLYVGDVTDADSHGLIKELGITHVLNCAGNVTDFSRNVETRPKSCLAQQSKRKMGPHCKASRSCQQRSTTSRSCSCHTSGPYGGDTGVRVYRQVAVLDRLDYDILQHFEDAKNLLNEARDQGGRALVYCMKGVNRSVTLCVAYLMDLLRCDVLDAVERIARVRGDRILTNPGFRRQLVEFSEIRDLSNKDVL